MQSGAASGARALREGAASALARAGASISIGRVRLAELPRDGLDRGALHWRARVVAPP